MAFKFSVVVETSNVHDDNEIPVEDSLKRIVEWSKNLDREIIVVDSTEDKRVKKACSAYPEIIRVSQPGALYPECKNLGFHHSKGDIVVFLDSDCVIEDGWFEEMAKSFEQDIDAVTGFTHFKLSSLRRKVLSWPVFLPKPDWEQTSTFMGNNVAVKREFFERFPLPEGFPDITASSIVIAGWDWHKAGVRMFFNPKMEVSHTFYPHVFTNNLNAGFSNVLVRQKEPSFPLSKPFMYLHFLFPIVTYVPRLFHDFRGMIRARKLLRLSFLEIVPACLLLSYYRFCNMLGMVVALIYPGFFNRPGQKKAF
jgi:glycosyltransferase involved in cell wall biosynthesis